MDPRSNEVRWPLWQRLCFRFFCSWFLLHSFPWPLSLIPGTGKAVAFHANHWNDLVSWIGAHVLHLAEPLAEQTNGSGDRLFSWVEMGCYAAFGLLFAAAWSVLDRERPHDRRLHGWLRIFVRYELASR
jgi:hypothetical protein